jgi:hypothetical protein
MRTKMAKECELYDRLCISCGECDLCDLDSEKKCSNCGKCITDVGEFRSLNVEKFIKDKEES